MALRVPLVLKATIDKGYEIEEQGLTLVVNAHGGLMESSRPLETNLEIALSHPQTGKTARARIVGAGQSTPKTVTMAFELCEPASHFWPVHAPPEDWKALAP